MYRRWIAAVALVAAGLVSTTARADEAEMTKKLKLLEDRLNAQEKRLVEQDAELAKLKLKQSNQRLSAAHTVEIKKLIKEMNDDAAKHSGLPEWLDDLEFFGDFRLRFQHNDVTTLRANGSGVRDKGRNRFRGRLRVGLKKYWLDKQMEVGFRLATGSDTPTSTNQTFDDYFDKKAVWVDLMWAKYKPKVLPGFVIVGGKMKNPLVHTDMMWDSDVNPEGIWAQYKHLKIDAFQPFVSVGYWTVDDRQSWAANNTHSDGVLGRTRRSPDMWTYQAGFDWKIKKDVKYTFAATYYQSDGYDIGSGAAWGYGGNTIDPIDGVVAGGAPQIYDFINKVSWKMFKLPWAAYFDIAQNVNENDRTWRGNQDLAYAIGLKVGKNKKKGDWSLGYQYKYIQSNAVFGAWNDADFGNTNSKGHVWGAKYNLTDFLTLQGKVFLTSPIQTDTWQQNVSPDNDVLTIQADLVWKF